LFQPIQATTIVQQIIDKITQSLVRGELQPGDRLPPEPELAIELGVSRTSLREALKTLCGLGVLVAKKRGGTFVATSVSQAMLDPLVFSLIIDKGSGDELFELRALLEMNAVELAIKKATSEDLMLLAAELENFQNYIPTGNLDRLAEMDLQFHLLILQFSKNAPFIRINQVIMRLFSQPINRALKESGPEVVLQSHRQLYEVIAKRDLEGAKAHILRSFETFRKFL